MEPILQALNAGGNIALVAIAVAIYRHEIRLIKLEMTVGHITKENDE